MRTVARTVLVLATVLAAAQAVQAQSALEITLKHGSPAEAQTRDQLRRLVSVYDVTPWIYTQAIVIDERATPFSHPVLTIHTRHAKDDELLLSTFLHEQLHWFLSDRPEATQQAIGDLRQLFTTVPVGGRAGARDEHSTYLHLLVCYLEQQANLRVFGELKTRQIMEFWASDHYTWIYQTVLDRGADIRKTLLGRKLLPAP